MPGFPSSFDAPDDRTIERYLKFKRMADPASGAMPNEMASARREMEKLDAQYPSLRALGAAGPAAGAVPPPGGMPDWLRQADAWVKQAESFVKNVNGALTARTLALTTSDVRWRDMPDKRIRVSATLPADVIADVLEMKETERRQYATAVGEMVINQLLAALQEIDE